MRELEFMQIMEDGRKVSVRVEVDRFG